MTNEPSPQPPHARPAVTGIRLVSKLSTAVEPARPGAGDNTASTLATLPYGYRLQRYRIAGALGRGGFGVTYLAQDTRLQREVALKEFLPPGLAARHSSDREVQPASGDAGNRYRDGLTRFITEARTLARFCHPAIVQVYNVFKANGTAYIVMEYRRGRTLEALLHDGQHCDERSLIAMLSPLLSALTHLHAAGYVHRDVKPANIYVGEERGPMLLDFGSAGPASQGRGSFLALSAGYAPYERYRGAEEGPWTDIYGVGATLYEAVTAQPPPDGLTRARAILNGRPDPLVPVTNAGAGAYSPAFLGAIDAALSFEPARRPRSILALQAMIGSSVRGREQCRPSAASRTEAPPSETRPWVGDVETRRALAQAM